MGSILWLYQTEGLFIICAPETDVTKFLSELLSESRKKKLNFLNRYVLTADLIFFFFFSFFFYCIIDITKIWAICGYSRIVILVLLLTTKNQWNLVSVKVSHFCIFLYYHLLLLFYWFESFLHQHLRMIFQWNVGDSKSLQVSRTLLSTLANLDNAVGWLIGRWVLGVSTLFESFNAELDFNQFSLI